MAVHWRWGPLRSLLVLSPILIGVPLLALKQHYTLPEPLVDLVNPVTQLPQISEANILGVAKYLSEDIGFRTVGTFEHALADTWMLQKAEELQQECERVAIETGRKLECEVWHQRGSGSHRFDMMGRRLYKTYVNLTNIVVRISNGTPAGKEHALLVNSHLDSTLPSPGAADDGLAVGVMVDCMRVLINTPDWSPKHATVFLFNHAEESLQDGSHLFSTQHPVASTIRAVINLEAAGTTGRELLFQATSEQMIQAYSHVPRPFGTVFANEIFSSGILLSDTDFRQFEYYLNVTGLDMAVVGNSYLYHMRKDLVEHIEPGVAQNMAENTLALLKFLSSEDSPLPNLTAGYTRPTTVYFTLFGTFYMYSFKTAKIMYSALFLASLFFVRISSQGGWTEWTKGLVAVMAAVAGTVIMPNVVALAMSKGLNKGMSWFTSPFAPLVLYGPPTLLGALLSQYLVGPTSEQSIFKSLLLVQSAMAYGVQMAGVGSACLFFFSAFPIFFSLLINVMITGSTADISLFTYGLAQVEPLLIGALVLATICEVFVPLTGRVGAQAPADNIVATIVAVLGAQMFPVLVPLAHRFGRRKLWNGIVLSSIATAIMMAVFSARRPFDEMHQKRLFVLHTENITSNEQRLHIGRADGAPGFELLVEDIIKEFSATDVLPKPEVMNDYNSDWDALYPFSTFLSAYKVPLTIPEDYVSPWTKPNDQTFTVSAINNIYNAEAGTRSLTLEVKHPGIIWSVIAFDAHVLSWTLDDNPPKEHVRHFIREASFYGTDTWSVGLVIESPKNVTDDDSLFVNFVGIAEKGMWPAKKAVKAEGGPAMRLFEQLDSWLETRSAGTVDALLISCISGVSQV